MVYNALVARCDSKKNKHNTTIKIMAKQNEKEIKKQEEMAMMEAEFAKIVRYETTADSMSVADMITRLDAGIIDKAAFQRDFRWSDKDKSCLIESLLLGYTPPCLFAFEEKENRVWKMKFHDGLQRSNSIWKFVCNKYSLKGLEVLTFLNGKKYEDLPYSIQHALQSSILHVVKFVKGTPQEVVKAHFNRLNIKGVPLTQAEVFRGSYNSPYYNLLSELAENADFLASIGTKGTGKKKKELAHEKMAMYWATLFHNRVWENGVVNYKNSPEGKGGWIEQHMAYFYENESEITSELLETTKAAFNKAVRLNKLVLGDNYFRKPKVVDGAFELDAEGNIALCNTNNGLFECMMYFMSVADEQSVIDNHSVIKDAIFNGLRYSPSVFTAFDKANQNVTSANIRFPFIYNTLKSCGVKFIDIDSEM